MSRFKCHILIAIIDGIFWLRYLEFGVHFCSFWWYFCPKPPIITHIADQVDASAPGGRHRLDDPRALVFAEGA